MARWDAPVLWALCWTVLRTATPMASGSLGRSWCYTKDELPHTISCNQGKVLAVVRAVPRVHTLNHQRFCQNPQPDSTDCQLTEHAQTDHFRQMCNMQQTCIFLLVRQPRNNCMVALGGAMYLHMEYACISDTSVRGKKFPVVHPSLSRHSVGTGTVVRIQSSSYPSLWDNLTYTHCTVSANRQTMVVVTIRELILTPSAGISCGYKVYLGNTTKICSKPGMAARTRTLQIGRTEERQEDRKQRVTDSVDTHLRLTTGNPESSGVLGRYWVEIAGFAEDGILPASVDVTCTNQLLPHSALYTNGGDDSTVYIWLPILIVLLLIVVAVIIVGLIIWCLRRRRKKTNISQTEADDAEEGRACCSRLPCLWKLPNANDSQRSSEGSDKGGPYSSCLCKRKPPNDSNPEPENDEKSDLCHSVDTSVHEDVDKDLCHSVDNSVHEDADKGETCFSRLRKRLSRKKSSPPFESDKMESAHGDPDKENSEEQVKLSPSEDSGVSDYTDSGGDTPEREHLNRDTVLSNRSETAV